MRKEQQEISLLEIWQVIVRQKKVVFITWAMCVGLGLAYVLLVTPVYKAEIFMLPPSQKDIQSLNISALVTSDRSEYTTEGVYRLFVQTLKSRAVRRAFYEENQVAAKLGYNEADDPDVFFENRFYRKLKIEKNIKQKEEKGFVTLSFEGGDPFLTAELVNSFVEQVASMVAVRLKGEVTVKVSGLKLGIEKVIQGKKSLAKTRRDDQIIALQEAYRVSQALNEKNQQVKSKILIGGVSVNTEKIPLFMLSVDALKAQITVLKERQDDAPFIEGLRDLEEHLIALESAKVSTEKVSVVSIDQQAWVSKSPIKPKKSLILLLANLSGLLLGVIVAILRRDIAKTEDVF